MTTPSAQTDHGWGMLVDAASEERESKMLQRYQEMAALSEQARTAQMLAMVRAEYALPDHKLRSFTLSRLRTWLKLEEGTARAIVTSYDAAMEKIPGQLAMRRVSLVQTLAREFSADDEEKLRSLVPRVFAGMPSRATIEKSLLAAPSVGSQTRSPKKRSWWPFGGR
ncbi:MAG: hypothetical protein HYX93_01895 [Chloroflexi bacterium]|nr:hypothetical protein [Chloroflexota bacterium]